ncbi:MAG: hypothetical protein ACTSUE_26030 [Promethearchaeota archaeon]
MIEKGTLNQIACNFIEKMEALGGSAGGSGHAGYKSYMLDGVTMLEERYVGEITVFLIEISYTIFVETEFTYYPDNPPHEYKYKKHILIDESGAFIREVIK